MLEHYLIVHKSVLPDYFEKVVEARRLIESGKAPDVSSAVKMAGISRSTFYKYKDYILEPSAMSDGRKAVLSVMLVHETAVLSALLARVSEAGCTVLPLRRAFPFMSVPVLHFPWISVRCPVPLTACSQQLPPPPGLSSLNCSLLNKHLSF